MLFDYGLFLFARVRHYHVYARRQIEGRQVTGGAYEHSTGIEHIDQAVGSVCPIDLRR